MSGNTSVYAHTVQLDKRDDVQAALKQKGIPTVVHYPTLLCQQPALRCEHSVCSGGRHTHRSGLGACVEPTYASLAQ